MFVIRLSWVCCVLLLASAAGAAPTLEEAFELRARAENREFAELESQLRTWHDAGEHMRVVGALAVLALGPPSTTARLEEWAEAMPGSALAHMANARRELALGWRARGSGMSNTVTDKGRALAQHHAGRSLALADEAAAMEPTWALPHVSRLRAARLLGDRELEAAAFQQGVTLEPANRAIWEHGMLGRMRRWGGSHEELEELGKHAQGAASLNPELVLLQGLADWDRGRDLMMASDWAGAHAAFTRALRFGERADALSNRAWCALKLGRPAEGLADVERAIALDPWGEDHHIRKAHLLAGLSRFAESRDAADIAHRLEPGEPHNAWMRGWAEKQLQRQQRWEAFKAEPTVKEALAYASGWLYYHMVESVVFLIGVAALVRGGRWWLRRRAGPATADAQPSTVADTEPAVAHSAAPDATRAPLATPRGVGILLLRAYVWLQIAHHVSAYVAFWDGASALHRYVDLPITAIALLGALGFAHRWVIGIREFWRLWAVVYPVWNAIFNLLLSGHTWEVALGDFVVMTFSLLPVYLALLAYGFASNRLWEGPSVHEQVVAARVQA
ncbi:MAG: hypothetical protein QNK05_15575 [Myxococcota bacterium]|nr:hypothetical protein [Myxococcota bacterium]